MPPLARGIAGAAAVCLALHAAAFTLPRLFVGPGGGLEDSAAAALTFIVCEGVAALLSISLLVRTIRSRSALPGPHLLAGILPAVATVFAGWYISRAIW